MRKKTDEPNKDVKVTMIHRSGQSRYEAWLKLYEEDPVAARVWAMNKKEVIKYIFLYESSKTNYRLEEREKVYGVGANGRRYIRYSRNFIVLVSPKGVFIEGRKTPMLGTVPVMRPLKIHEFGALPDEMKDVLRQRMPWINAAVKLQLHPMSLNTIMDNKLNSKRKVLEYKYKVAYPTAVFIHEYCRGTYDNLFQTYRRFIVGDTNPNLRLFAIGLKARDAKGRDTEEPLDPYNEEHMKVYGYSLRPVMLCDTIVMAGKLLRKVNLGWSVKRLKREHDQMAKEITRLALKFPDYKLKTNPKFKTLAKYLNQNAPNGKRVKVIDSFHQLVKEGMRNNNCVANYAPSVESGRISIMTYGESTIEVWRNGGTNLYSVVQQSTRGNSDPPEDEKTFIKSAIESFNQTFKNTENVVTG